MEELNIRAAERVKPVHPFPAGTTRWLETQLQDTSYAAIGTEVVAEYRILIILIAVTGAFFLEAMARVVIYGKTQSSCCDFDKRLGHFRLTTVGPSLETADLSVSETADCHHYHPCIFTFRVRMDPDIIAT
jgi:hypothetical protein